MREVHPHLLPSDVNKEMVEELLKSFGFVKLTRYPRNQVFHLIAYKQEITKNC